VLRTSNTGPPFGACNCAVATGLTGNTVNDQTNALNAYTVNTLDPGTLNVVLQDVNGALTANGNPITGGGGIFNSITAATASFSGLSTYGSAAQALQGGFPTNVPNFITTLQSSSNAYFQNPDLYISRIDSTPYATGAGQCFQGPLAACDAPISHIEFTNQSTGNIPGMIGLLVDGHHFAANGFTSPPAFSDFEVGLGVQMQDAAVDNITNLRGANLITVVNGLPTHAGPGGFTRSAVGAEIDVNVNAGADAVTQVGSGPGNFVAAITATANGNNSASTVLQGASSAVAGKGWRNGVILSGITDLGLGIFEGGSGSFSPSIGVAVADGGSVGLQVGSGTTAFGQGTAGNPTTAILLDAKGTNGVSETQSSNVLSLRAKHNSASGTDWQLQHVGAASVSAGCLQFTLIGVASYFKFCNQGNLVLSGSAGQHINTSSANNDIDGLIAVSASTSGSHTFSVPYSSAPSCVLTPTSDPTAVGVWWVTTSTTAVTANVKTAGTISFSYHCKGNPN
jgi:hypothetical protein